jgi:hypothetical protein
MPQLPYQEEILSLMSGAKYITVIDATQFFYQWRIHPSAYKHVAVVSHRGQEYFKVCPMGFRNSGTSVQRQIDNIFRDLRSFWRGFIDDFVIWSSTLEDHASHLHQVLQRCHELRITLNPDKSICRVPVCQAVRATRHITRHVRPPRIVLKLSQSLNS